MRVVALIPQVTERQAVERGLRARGLTPMFFDRPAPLLRTVDAGHVAAVLTRTRDANLSTVAPMLSQLAAQHPMIPLLLQLALTQRDIRDTHDILAAGVGVQLVIDSVEDLGAAVRSAITGARASVAETELFRRIPVRAGGVLQPFFVACALQGHRPLTVAGAAALTRTPVRTLESQLARARLPVARRVIAWYRVLHCALRLDVLSLPVKQVAAELGLPTPRALHRLLRHHAGMSLTEVMARGGFPFLLTQFDAALADPIQRVQP